jgi:hypothetical protein
METRLWTRGDAVLEDRPDIAIVGVPARAERADALVELNFRHCGHAAGQGRFAQSRSDASFCRFQPQAPSPTVF